MSDHLIAEANRHAKALPVNPDRLALALALQTIDELERENAALRQECDELLAELKAQAKQLTQSNRELAQETSLRKIREAIDAARKEAQP